MRKFYFDGDSVWEGENIKILNLNSDFCFQLFIDNTFKMHNYYWQIWESFSKKWFKNSHIPGELFKIDTEDWNQIVTALGRSFLEIHLHGMAARVVCWSGTAQLMTVKFGFRGSDVPNRKICENVGLFLFYLLFCYILSLIIFYFVLILLVRTEWTSTSYLTTLFSTKKQ